MLRKVGNIMLDMEKLLIELHEKHDLQHGEVLFLIHGWQKVHAPDHLETYQDDTHPIFYYGPEGIINGKQ